MSTDRVAARLRAAKHVVVFMGLEHLQKVVSPHFGMLWQACGSDLMR